LLETPELLLMGFDGCNKKAPRKALFCDFLGGGAAASTKHHQLGAFLLAKAAENIRGKTPNQAPVYQMRMVGPIENAGLSSIPKRAVEPTPILM
jgi:hypothetical protein